DPKVFPELLHYEGLAPWRVRKLYWTSFGGMSTLKMPTDGVAQGVLAAANPGKRYADIAMDAERNHRSQGFDKFMDQMASSGQRRPAFPNNYLLVKSRIPIAPRADRDLLDGTAGANLTGPDTQHDPLARSLPQNADTLVEARIQPSPPVRNYR